MRITIWREFSSNHSARFTVVGVFETPEKAAKAAEELNSLAREVYDWYHLPENADGLERFSFESAVPATPIELQIAEDYGIDWGAYSVDWLGTEGAALEPALAIDNLVLVDGSESSFGAHPADRLVESLGGQSLVDGSVIEDGEEIGSPAIFVFLTCVTPDERTAEAVAAHGRAHLLNLRPGTHERTKAPWSLGWRPSAFVGSVRRDGRRVTIERGQFYPFAIAFPAMLDYLRASGCSDITYMLAEVHEGEDWLFDNEG